MAKNMQLNGMIHARFDSESDMARSMGWSRQRLWKITNGKKVPDLFELRDMADAMGCTMGDLAHIFLPNQSANVDEN